MAVMMVKEHTQGQTGMRDDKRVREYTRVFTVEVSSSTDGPEIVLNAVGIPRIWAPYVPSSGVIDVRSWCRSVDATRTESPYVWIVTAKYSSKIDPLNRPDQDVDNPTLRPPVISYSVVRVAVPWIYDRKGAAVVNSAGEQFDPPLEEDEKRLQIRIERNQLTYDRLLYLSYIDSINSDVWFGFGRGVVKCADIKSDLVIEANLSYWRVSFVFEVKYTRIPLNARPGNVYDKIGRRTSKAWTRWILDRGYRERDANNKLVPILSRDGAFPVSQPALLNGEGRAILRPSNKRVVDAVPPDNAGDLDEEDIELVEYDESAIELVNQGGYTTGTGTGTAVEITEGDPVFLGYNQFPAKKFARLGIF